ncbi:MAG: PilZ domain-containing protein [Acidobacteriota bacterium]
MNDRRSEDRSHVSYHVKLTVGEGDELDAELADHSPEGMRLILVSPIRIGSRVSLSLEGGPFIGTVRYCTRDEDRGKYVVGVLLGS